MLENQKKLFEKINKTYKISVVIKPINEGSSVGVLFVKNFIKKLEKIEQWKNINWKVCILEEKYRWQLWK